MRTVREYPEGIFCWVDLASSDAEAAKAFYARLFGWETEDAPAGEGMTDIMCRLDGEDVCALYAMSAGMREQGTPPHWASYLNVPDIDAALERAVDLGASSIMAERAVPGIGRLAVLADPQGAAFSVIALEAADPPPGY